MERMDNAHHDEMSAWMASGGAISSPMGLQMRDGSSALDGEMSAAGFTWNPNAPQCIDAEFSDSALSAAAVTGNTGNHCRMEVEPNDAALNAAASTSVSFGCPVF